MGKVGSILKNVAAAQAGKPKKKSTIPEVEIPGIDMEVRAWMDAHKAEKDAIAKKAQAEAKIIPVAEDERIKASMAKGENASSVRINGKILVSVQDRYKKIPADAADEIRKVVGSDFDRLFRDKTTISLTDEAVASEEVLGKLMTAVGEENFGRWFKVEQTIEPTEAFHNGRSTDKKLNDAYKTLKDKGLVENYKAAVKPS
jgi:hypothetical protein